MSIKWRERHQDKEKGFTLVELIIVMAILAILAGIAVPKFGDILQQSKYKAHNANVDMLAKTAQLYITEKGNPGTAIAAADGINTLVTAGYLESSANTLKRPYDSANGYTLAITTAGVITIAPGKSPVDASGKYGTPDASYTP